MKKKLANLGSISFLLILMGCAHHPLDCAIGGGLAALHNDCLPGTAGYEEAQQREQSYDATCKSYGLKFGTPAYAQCRENFESQQNSNNQAAIHNIMQNQQFNQQQQQLNMQQQMQLINNNRSSKPINCLTSYSGNSASTNCN